MPIERRDILFFFSEVQFALQRMRHVPGGETIPPEIDDGAIIEAMHTARDRHTFHDLRARMFSGLDPDLVKRGGIAFRASRTGGFPRSNDFTFFVPDQIIRETLALECRNRGIMLPAGVEKEVVVDLLMVGLRLTISDDLKILGEAG